jgi:hypothetical protein
VADFRKAQSSLVAKQLSQRHAVKSAWERSKLVVSRKTYHLGKFSARVLYEGLYYDVGEWEFAKLQAGKTPSDLGLEPNGDGDE